MAGFRGGLEEGIVAELIGLERAGEVLAITSRNMRRMRRVISLAVGGADRGDTVRPW